jgi:hypothetical protein
MQLLNIITFLWGFILIILGVLKIVTLIAQMPTFENIVSNIDNTILKNILQNDKSTLGRVINYVLLLIGIVAMIKGFYLVGISIHTSIFDIIYSRTFTILFQGVLGMFLLLFVNLVLNDIIKITRDKTNIIKYRFNGEVLSLILLSSIPISLISYQIYQYGLKKTLKDRYNYIIPFAVIVLILYAIIIINTYDIIKNRNNEQETVLIVEIIAFIIIILNII